MSVELCVAVGLGLQYRGQLTLYQHAFFRNENCLSNSPIHLIPLGDIVVPVQDRCMHAKSCCVLALKGLLGARKDLFPSCGVSLCRLMASNMHQ